MNDYDKTIWLKYSNGDQSKIWDLEFKPTSIYGLYNIAKEVNPETFKKWLIDNRVYISLKNLNNFNDLAIWTAKFINCEMVFCKNEWYICDKGLWTVEKDPTAFFISFIQNQIKQSIKTVEAIIKQDRKNVIELDELINNYEEYYKSVCNSQATNQIKKFLMMYLKNDNFDQLLDNSLYKLAFKNGIMDLKTLTFSRGIKREDYISKTIPWNWEEPNDEDVEFVKINLKKICNWNDEHLDYYLSSIGYALTGDSSREQLFNYFKGETAENGKSVVFEALNRIIPNYCKKGDSDVLDKTTDLKKDLPSWRGLKILWLNELTERVKDSERIKELCDGTSMACKMLYSVESVEIPIRFKLFCVSNHSLNSKFCKGLERRFRLGHFKAKFEQKTTVDNYETLEFVRDKSFSSKLETCYKTAFLKLLMIYANYYANEYELRPYPKEWEYEALDDVTTTNNFNNWFENNFIVGKNFHCHNEIFSDKLKKAELGFIKAKDEFRRMKLNFKYESQLRLKQGDEGYYKPMAKGYWVGFKCIDEVMG